MDFGWSEEQLRRRDEVVEFARTELADRDLAALDRAGTFPREDWERCARFGILGLAIPGKYGGDDGDLLTATLVMEGLGYGCLDVALPFALSTQLWTVQHPIAHFGTEEQKRRFLPGLCAGEIIGAHALTEPEAGSNAFGLAMRAEKRDGGYVLNGRKRLITLGPVADVALVFASTRPDAGKWGISAFLVESDSDGYRASPAHDKMGMRTIPLGEILLEDCWVPESNRVGAEGAGVSISAHALETERGFLFASQLGSMERQLEAAIEFAGSREQFGRPIGRFQSVSNRIADMKIRLETARLLMYRVAWLKDTGRPAMLEAAMLKLYLSEAFVASGLDAVRIHGGTGYLSEAGIERDLRDAIGGVLYAGTSDIQRNIIAKLLGL